MNFENVRHNSYRVALWFDSGRFDIVVVATGPEDALRAGKEYAQSTPDYVSGDLSGFEVGISDTCVILSNNIFP